MRDAAKGVPAALWCGFGAGALAVLTSTWLTAAGARRAALAMRADPARSPALRDCTTYQVCLSDGGLSDLQLLSVRPRSPSWSSPSSAEPPIRGAKVLAMLNSS